LTFFNALGDYFIFHEKSRHAFRKKDVCSLGLPYVRFFLDMSGILVANYASGRNVEKCFNVRDFGIMHLMKSNHNDFTVRII